MVTNQIRYNTTMVYADALDSGAEGLIRALCGNLVSQGSTIRIMPDVHAGKGCAVGTTITIGDCVAPGLVGADIGCGMTMLKVSARRLEFQKLDKLIRKNIPAGRTVRAAPHRFARQGWNRFAACGTFSGTSPSAQSARWAAGATSLSWTTEGVSVRQALQRSCNRSNQENTVRSDDVPDRSFISGSRFSYRGEFRELIFNYKYDIISLLFPFN